MARQKDEMEDAQTKEDKRASGEAGATSMLAGLTVHDDEEGDEAAKEGPAGEGEGDPPAAAAVGAEVVADTAPSLAAGEIPPQAAAGGEALFGGLSLVTSPTNEAAPTPTPAPEIAAPEDPAAAPPDVHDGTASREGSETALAELAAA